MMEISMILSQLKNESSAIEKSLKPKEESAEKFRTQLKTLDAEILQLRDKRDALKIAIDALELVHTPVAESEPPKHQGRGVGYSKKPRPIVKYNPKGVRIGQYPSLNVAAKQFGWTTKALRKYIDSTSKDRQIKLRGYYLEFLAA